jgi:hypothetical protein
MAVDARRTIETEKERLRVENNVILDRQILLGIQVCTGVNSMKSKVFSKSNQTWKSSIFIWRGNVDATMQLMGSCFENPPRLLEDTRY